MTTRDMVNSCGLRSRSVGIPLGLELSATIVVNCALRLLSASASTVCATYSLSDQLGKATIVRVVAKLIKLAMSFEDGRGAPEKSRDV